MIASTRVAPLVGAWIEISTATMISSNALSLLSWERGLKYCSLNGLVLFAVVAPLVGAWIEIVQV